MSTNVCTWVHVSRTAKHNIFLFVKDDDHIHTYVYLAQCSVLIVLTISVCTYNCHCPLCILSVLRFQCLLNTLYGVGISCIVSFTRLSCVSVREQLVGFCCNLLLCPSVKMFINPRFAFTASNNKTRRTTQIHINYVLTLHSLAFH